MPASSDLNRTLNKLRLRLNYVNRAWSVDNYEAMLSFYVDTVPKLVEAERCAIFIVDPVAQRLLSKIGTGLGEGDIEAPLEGSVVGETVSAGEVLIRNNILAAPGFHRQADAKTGIQTRDLVCAPIKSLAGGRVTGVLEAMNKTGGLGFTTEDGRLLQQIADYLSQALDSILLNDEILSLSRQVDREVAQFSSTYLGNVPFVAESASMRKVLELVQMVTATPVNVVIQGENGTGKEVIARMIHEGGERHQSPFVAVNCAAIPELLMESEFFGYEKGAFTGAVSARRGRFEEAGGGTLFLDEVVDLPLSLQPKFLRAIQEGEGARLGSNSSRNYDFRIVCASNKDLKHAVDTGGFREDLYYRLFSVEVTLPPLRERGEDIAPLMLAFIDDVSRRFNKTMGGVSPELVAVFESYSWPGNVRQLRREIERLIALTPEGEALVPARCSEELREVGGRYTIAAAHELHLPERVRALEIQLIDEALKRCGGNRGRAAGLLNITRQGLHKKIKRYELN